MRNTVIRIAFVCLGWTTVASAAESTACDPWAAKVVSIQGTVEARHTTTDSWQAVKLNAVYCSGDSLRVAEQSRAAVVLANQTLLRLDQNSSITLTAIKADSPSLLEILTGWVHFISRVPRSLQVTTPYVNAAIEGTEFVVAVDKDHGSVTVFEGKVRASNTAGEVSITHNETAIAKQGEAPQKMLRVKPRDMVQWALYYPPIFVPGDPLAPAADLLYHGRVEAARAALAPFAGTPDNAKAKALVAIIDVVNNDTVHALQLAKDAVTQEPNVAATHMALSYAQQATFDLDAALSSAQQAVTAEPNNALAYARLAELQLSVGYLHAALESAQHAVQLDSIQARAHTILGFAYLTQIHIDAAVQTFNTAIELDQADPLPRLGLGLAKIRKNDLADGRREIEIAALLDPNNALIRSYLGKAYFEEKRARIDADQFAMAKELDPNDPTPWFYDAIRKQTENRPVEALQDLQKSIELNDNRAVYRSRLQLDQDEAARGISLARIYTDLGLDHLALLESYKSVNSDPSNYSAHRFLSDSYAKLSRFEIARISELLQAQLLQPVNTNSLQPQLAEKNLNTIENFGSVNSNEFDSIFNRNSIGLQLYGISGGNSTSGSDVIVSGIQNSTSYSFGEYNYTTEGFRPNNDINDTIQDFFVQHSFAPSFSVQAEHRKRNTKAGDLLLQFDPNIYDSTLRNTIDTESDRLGMHYMPTQKDDVLFSIIKGSNNENKYNSEVISNALGAGLDAFGEKVVDINSKSTTSEIQYIYHPNKFKIIIGAGSVKINRTDLTTTKATALPPLSPTVVYYSQTSLNLDTEHNNAYTYLSYQPSQYFIINAGFAYDDFRRIDFHTSKLSPKLGVIYELSQNTLLRAASFRSFKRPLFTSQTLEPTQISGFNQFYDDIDATEITINGAALEHTFTDKIHAGITASSRSLSVPTIDTTNNSVTYDKQHEFNRHTYLYWILSNTNIIAADYFYEKFTSKNPLPDTLITHRFPISITSAISKNVSSKIVASYINQDLDKSNNIQNARFWLTDLSASFRLPKRAGFVTLGGKNIFNKKFNYYNLEFTGEPRNPLFQPGQFWYCELSFTLN